jgi:hypothetical protein
LHEGQINDAPGNENIRIIRFEVSPLQGDILSISSCVVFELEFYNYRAGINLDATFELKSSSEKLAEFLKYVDSSTLRPGQKELVKIMIDVCKHDHDSFRDFMKEVNETAQKAGFSSDNIRKLLERIRLNMRGNDGAKNLLTFVRKSDDSIFDMIGFLNEMSSSIDMFDGNYNWNIQDSLRGIYNEEYDMLKNRILEICTDPFDVKVLESFIKDLLKATIIDTSEGGIIIESGDLRLLLKAILNELMNDGIISSDVVSSLFVILN